MVSVAGERLEEFKPKARSAMRGHELNPESYAICKADMLINGQSVYNVILCDALSDDDAPIGVRLHAV